MDAPPPGLSELGRWLVIAGLVAVAAGVLLMVLPRVPWLGRLPGDILVQRDRFTVYAPLATSLLVSIVLTLLVNLFFRR